MEDDVKACYTHMRIKWYHWECICIWKACFTRGVWFLGVRCCFPLSTNLLDCLWRSVFRPWCSAREPASLRHNYLLLSLRSSLGSEWWMPWPRDLETFLKLGKAKYLHILYLDLSRVIMVHPASQHCVRHRWDHVNIQTIYLREKWIIICWRSLFLLWLLWDAYVTKVWGLSRDSNDSDYIWDHDVQGGLFSILQN